MSKKLDLSKIKPSDFSDHLGDDAKPEVLHHIATHPETSWSDLHSIADHDNASGDTLNHLHKLATDQIPHANLDEYDKRGLKDRIYKHPNAPLSMIEGAHDALKADWKHNRDAHKIAFHSALPIDKVTDKFKKIAGDKFENLKGYGSVDKELIENYIKHPGMTSEKLQPLLDSEDPEVARIALNSKHTTPEQQIAAWGDSKFKHEHLSSMTRHENLHPSTVQHIHDDIRGRMTLQTDAGDTESTLYRRLHENMSNILRHKNVAPEIMDHYLNSPNSDFKDSIVRNPSLGMDKLHTLAATGNESAMNAVFARGKDAPAETLRAMNGHIKTNNNKYQSGHQASLISNPNTPDDILKERASVGAHPAYKVLERKSLSPEVLKHLVDHKTKGVALDALSHPSVTKEVIDHALKRKMKEVNQKASLHTLAPKDQKYEKFLKDPKSVHAGFDKGHLHHDPEFVNQAAEKHGTDPSLIGKLLGNKHLSPENAKGLLTHLDAAQAELKALPADTDRAVVQAAHNKYNNMANALSTNHRDIEDNQGKFDSDARKLIMKHHPGIGGDLKDLTPEEMTHGLEHWNAENQNQATNLAESLFHHDNLSPDIAKDFLQGKYGKLKDIDDGNSWRDKESKIQQTIHNKPNVFTDEVIKAGINANPEFQHETVTKALASSPTFNPQNWDDTLNNIKPGLDSTDEEKKRYNSVLRGMYSNPNISSDHADAALNSEDFYHEALSNPKLKTKSITDFVKMAEGDDVFEHMDRNKREAIAKTLANRKDGGAAKVLASTNDPRMSDKILSEHPDKSNFLDKNFEKIAKNPNHEVVKQIINDHFHGISNVRRAELADKMMDHPDLGVRSTAFNHMSNDKKNEYMAKYGDSDPSIIRGVDKEKLDKIKIKPETHPDVVKAVMENGFCSDQHLKDAVDHSPEMAQMAMRKAFQRGNHEPYLDVVRKHWTKEKQDKVKASNKAKKDHAKSINEGAQSIVDKVIDKHAESIPIMKEYYDHNFGRHLSNKIDAAGRKKVSDIIDNERVPEEVKAHILKTDSGTFSADQLHMFKDSKSPEMSDAMSRAKNMSPDLFKHLVEKASPDQEYYYAVSNHIKDASPDTIKKLASSSDKDAKVALAENPHTPADIKTELLKDPHVLLTARGNTAQDTHLDHILDNHAQTDHELLHKIAKHQACTDDLRSKIVKIAASKIKDIKDNHAAKDGDNAEPENDPGMSDLHKAINASVSNLKDGKLQGEAQQALAQHGNEDAVYKYLGKNQGKTIDDKAAKMIHDNFHDGIRGGFIEDLLNTRFKNPELSKKLIESGTSAGNFHQISNHIKMNKHLGDDVHDLAYDGLKNAQERDSGSAELLKQLLHKGHAGITNELLNAHPDMVHHASQNKKIDGPTFKEATHKAMDNLKNSGNSLISEDGFKNIFDNPHTTSDDLAKFYDMFKDGSVYKSGPIKEHIARNPKTKPETLEAMANSGDTFLQSQALRNQNMPHSTVTDAIKRTIANETSYHHDSILESAMANPNVKWSDFKKEIDQRYPEGAAQHANTRQNYLSTVMQGLSKNDNLSNEDLGEIYDQSQKLSKDGTNRYYSSDNINSSLRKNANCKESLLRKMITDGNATESQLEEHPIMGGKLMREREHKFPKDVPNLQQGKEINEIKYIPKQEKYQAAIAALPPEGMDWGKFKKEQPKLAGDPDVQKMFFQVEGKQSCTPEQGKEYLDKQPGNHFHISYRNWTGMQRHDVDDGGNGKPQLVVQVNNSQEHDDELSKNPKLFKLYKFAQKSSNYSGHPTGSHSLAWSRVDTSNPEHWFIDEAQSDMNSSLSKGLREIEETGQSGSLQRQYGISAEEAQGLLPKLQGILKNWEKAAMNTVVELAKKHGVKRLSMHSGESKTAFNKPGQEVTTKYNKIYNDCANDVGMNKKVPYSTIGNHSKKKGHQPIWTMDLSGEDKIEKSTQRKGKSKVDDILDGLIKIEIDQDGKLVQRRHKAMSKETHISRMKAHEYSRRNGLSTSFVDRLLRNKDK